MFEVCIISLLITCLIHPARRKTQQRVPVVYQETREGQKVQSFMYYKFIM